MKFERNSNRRFAVKNKEIKQIIFSQKKNKKWMDHRCAGTGTYVGRRFCGSSDSGGFSFEMPGGGGQFLPVW